MPWRGPEEPGEFPTLGYAVAEYIQEKCAIPDGPRLGDPYLLTDEMLRFLLWFYRLRSNAQPADDRHKPASAFVHVRGGQLVRAQKWGKGPFSAANICAEADGPVVFDGWDARGDPVGRSWDTPVIQVTAVSEDQTDNVWTALVPMIELGDIAGDIPDTGETRINLPNGGKIEPVTASARSRLGQRITFAVQDESHSWLKQNGGWRLADNQRRNLAGMGGRFLETTNAWDPAEQSVAQRTFTSKVPGVYKDFPTSPAGDFTKKRERRKVLRFAYGDSWWVELDRIDAECEELIGHGDVGQAERFFGNRISAGADQAFDPNQWKALARAGFVVPAREWITLGFDGARRKDATALIGTHVSTGYQWVVGIWERPEHADADYEIDETAVDAAVAAAHDDWKVWRLYADPPYWESAVDRWIALYGNAVGSAKTRGVVRWWTNRPKQTAYACRAYADSQITAELSHDGNEIFARHIANARRKAYLNMLDDDGRPMWTIQKESAASTQKIDAAMAGVLSWEARGDAIAAGVLNRRRGVAGF